MSSNPLIADWRCLANIRVAAQACVRMHAVGGGLGGQAALVSDVTAH